MSPGCSFLGGTAVAVGLYAFMLNRTVEAGGGEDRPGHF